MPTIGSEVAACTVVPGQWMLAMLSVGLQCTACVQPAPLVLSGDVVNCCSSFFCCIMGCTGLWLTMSKMPGGVIHGNRLSSFSVQKVVGSQRASMLSHHPCWHNHVDITDSVELSNIEFGQLHKTVTVTVTAINYCAAKNTEVCPRQVSLETSRVCHAQCC